MEEVLNEDSKALNEDLHARVIATDEADLRAVTEIREKEAIH